FILSYLIFTAYFVIFFFFFSSYVHHRDLHSFPTRRSSDLAMHVLSEVMPKERAYHKIMDHLLSHFEHQTNFDGNIFGDGLPKELDRKSTRLNSSHLVISYAVFCLKKKKNKTKK